MSQRFRFSSVAEILNGSESGENHLAGRLVAAVSGDFFSVKNQLQQQGGGIAEVFVPKTVLPVDITGETCSGRDYWEHPSEGKPTSL